MLELLVLIRDVGKKFGCAEHRQPLKLCGREHASARDVQIKYWYAYTHADGDEFDSVSTVQLFARVGIGRESLADEQNRAANSRVPKVERHVAKRSSNYT